MVKLAKHLKVIGSQLMKKIIALCLISFIAACGFEPLYVQKKHNNLWYFGGEFDTSITSEMAQIKIQTIQERFGQQIRNNLLDMLTPLGTPRHPKYRLYVDLKEKEVMQQALRKDITATRERVKYMVEYRLIEGDTEVVRGDSIAYVSYDILANPYSTTTAKKKTEEDAAKIVANDIALRLGAYFHAYFKQGDKS